jgi:NTP pyrophosphatase (non-canonical NTP hydrolase)
MSIRKLTSDLQAFAQERDWEQFHTPKNLAMALAVEAAELMEHFQWLTPEDSTCLPAEKIQEISHELGDVFIYLARLADVLGVDLERAAGEKLQINRRKYPAELVKGSARKSTEYGS